MPVFVFLVVLGGLLLWLLLAFAFIPVGKIANKLLKDAEEAITYDENNDDYVNDEKE